MGGQFSTNARPQSLHAGFVGLVKAQEIALESLTPRQGVELMVRYFEDVRFPTRPRGSGDMLLYEHGTCLADGSLIAHVVRQLYSGRGIQLDLSWTTPFDREVDYTTLWTKDDFEGWRGRTDQALEELDALFDGHSLTVKLSIERF